MPIEKTVGSTWFVMGGKTSVKIIEVGPFSKCLCEILTAAPTSKYKIGTQVYITNKCLYPLYGKRYIESKKEEYIFSKVKAIQERNELQVLKMKERQQDIKERIKNGIDEKKQITDELVERIEKEKQRLKDEADLRKQIEKDKDEIEQKIKEAQKNG